MTDKGDRTLNAEVARIQEGVTDRHSILGAATQQGAREARYAAMVRSIFHDGNVRDWPEAVAASFAAEVAAAVSEAQAEVERVDAERSTALTNTTGETDHEPLRNQPEPIPGTDRVVFHNDAIGIPVERRPAPVSSGEAGTGEAGSDRG